MIRVDKSPPVRSTPVTPPALRQLLHRQRTFPRAAAAASLGGDELPAQLGQTGLQQPQVVGGGLVLLRPGHLQGHRTEGSHRDGSAALGPCATLGDRAPPPLNGAAQRPSPSLARAPRPTRSALRARPAPRYLRLNLRDLGQGAAHGGVGPGPPGRPSAPPFLAHRSGPRTRVATSRERRRTGKGARRAPPASRAPLRGGGAAPPGPCAERAPPHRKSGNSVRGECEGEMPQCEIGV